MKRRRLNLEQRIKSPVVLQILKKFGGSLNCASAGKSINILDNIDRIGVDATIEILDKFSTKRSIREDYLNEDIEIFLKNNVIQFSKEIYHLFSFRYGKGYITRLFHIGS